MRTTIDLDTERLDEIVRYTGLSSRREAIEAGLKLLEEQEASRRLAERYEAGERYPDAQAAPRRRY